MERFSSIFLIYICMYSFLLAGMPEKNGAVSPQPSFSYLQVLPNEMIIEILNSMDPQEALKAINQLKLVNKRFNRFLTDNPKIYADIFLKVYKFPLIQAVIQKKSALIQPLLDLLNDNEITKTDRENLNALWWSIDKGNFKIFKLLVDSKKFDLHKKIMGYYDEIPLAYDPEEKIDPVKWEYTQKLRGPRGDISALKFAESYETLYGDKEPERKEILNYLGKKLGIKN